MSVISVSEEDEIHEEENEEIDEEQHLQSTRRRKKAKSLKTATKVGNKIFPEIYLNNVMYRSIFCNLLLNNEQNFTRLRRDCNGIKVYCLL